MRIYFVFLLAFFSLVGAGFEARLIKEHAILEASDAQIISGGYLWMSEAAAHNTISLYTMDGTLFAKISVTHRPTTLDAVDENTVVTVGNDAAEGKSSLSILSLSEKKVIKKFVFDVNTVVEYFAKIGATWFLTVPNEHALGIFREGKVDRLDLGTDLPRRLISAGENLYFVERDFNVGDSLVRYSTESKQTTKVIQKMTGVPSHLWYLKGNNQVALSEPLGNRISLVDNEKGAVIQKVEIPGRPRAFANLGKCLLVTTELSNQLYFFDTSSKRLENIGRWDLTRLGANFTKANSVAADTKSGAIFVRSTNPCFSCMKSQSSTWRLFDAETATHCQKL